MHQLITFKVLFLLTYLLYVYIYTRVYVVRVAIGGQLWESVFSSTNRVEVRVSCYLHQYTMHVSFWVILLSPTLISL